MDERLLEAARSGNVETLEALLKADPLILEKVSLSLYSENPLHVASLAGHVDFVKRILEIKPSFAYEVNYSNGFTPLHFAAAAGHFYVVRELLAKLNPDFCLRPDHSGRTPLHQAAAKGRTDVIEELLLRCSGAIDRVTALGETAMHLAVKNSQFEALRILFEASQKLPNHEERLQAKDSQGKTVLDLALANKQLQVIEFLKQRMALDNYQEITVTKEIEIQVDNQAEAASKEIYNKLLASENIGVIAGLIATTTFQAILQPPKQIWDGPDAPWMKEKCAWKYITTLGTSTDCRVLKFYFFMVANTIGFAASTFVVPLSGQSQTMAFWLTVYSITGLTISYLTLLGTILPRGILSWAIPLIPLGLFAIFIYYCGKYLWKTEWRKYIDRLKKFCFYTKKWMRSEK